MTDWRPSPIRQIEIDRDTEEQKEEAESPSVPVAQAVEEPSPEANTTTGRIGAALKTLFREVKKALTGKIAKPKPKRRRKKGEDTQGLFRQFAKKVLAPVARSIFHTDFAWFLPPDECDDTDRLLMRQRNTHDAVWQQHDATSTQSHQNDLSPRP